MNRLLFLFLILLVISCQKDDKELAPLEDFPHDWNLTVEEVMKKADPHNVFKSEWTEAENNGKIVSDGVVYNYSYKLDYIRDDYEIGDTYFFNKDKKLCLTQIDLNRGYDPGFQSYVSYYKTIYGKGQNLDSQERQMVKFNSGNTDIYVISEKSDNPFTSIIYANSLSEKN